VSWFRRILRVLFAPAVTEAHFKAAPTVYIVEGQDEELLQAVARPIFGEAGVWIEDVGSEAALEVLNDLGDRFDIAYSQ